MTSPLSIGAVNHLTLTVTDLQRSKDFYTNVLGFQVIMEISPERVVLGNGQTLMGISMPLDKANALGPNDRFNENRVGLDHLSFTVPNREALEEALRIFEERGIPHGEITDLSPGGLPMLILVFRDPDNIQLELTAPTAVAAH
jgi:glyoxylase I family protein